MGRITQDCDVTLMPNRRDRMAKQTPKADILDLFQNAAQTSRNTAIGLAQIAGIIRVVPAFGGPLFAFLHGHDIQPPARQGICHHMAARGHPDTGHGICVG